MTPREPETEPPATEVDKPDEATSADDGVERGTELRTFLIADIRGYTTYTAEFGDAAAARLVARFSALVREVVEAREGFLLELRGDEALVVFVSARQALRAATELQRRFEAEGLPRGVGIGLDAGEAIPVDDGYRGTSLNVAARLCGQAGPGQILASETVIHLAAKVDGIEYVDPRTLRLKGLAQPVRAVAVVRTDQPGRGRRSRRPAGQLPDRRLIAGAAIVGLVLLVGAGALLVGPLARGPSGSPGRSAGPAASPTPVPSLAPGAGTIGAGDLPLLAWIDPASMGVLEALDEPGGGADATFADGDFWVLDRKPRAIHQIDPETGSVKQAIPIGFEVSAYAVGNGKLFVSELESVVHVYDIASGREVEPIVVGGLTAGAVQVSGLDFREPIWDLAFGDGSVWVAGGWAGDLIRVDPASGMTTARVSTVAPGIYGVADGVAYDDGIVWVLNTWYGEVLSVDPGSNAILSRAVLRSGVGPITAGGGAAWVADAEGGTVTKVDRLGGPRSFTVGAGVAAVAYDHATDTVWAASSDSGTLASVDAVTGEPRTASLGHAATSVAAHAGRVLVGMARSPAEVVAALQGTVLRMASEETFDATDPAYGWSSNTRRQFDAATCAPLLGRRADVGADGSLLEPVVAAAMPEVSEDGRTYTFTVRDGFAFSPPSNEPLTAETFRQSIERAVRMHPLFDEQRPFQLFDIEGVFTYRDGGADHISGIAVEGNRLSIRLTAPSPTFPERLSLPTFCPVPLGTPVVRTGIHDPALPRAGPYYIQEHVPGEVMILARNPNYPDPRPNGYDAIAWFTEPNLGRAVGRWDRDELDIVGGQGPELQLGSRADRRWGPGSEAAAAGDQRLHHRPLMEMAILAVNAASTSLSDPDVRRAVALAIDRLALSAQWGLPTDESMPSTMPGLVAGDRLPLDGPRPEEARTLLAGRTIDIRIAWPRETWCPECPGLADALERHLGEVGITATFQFADDPFLFAGGAESGYDLSFAYLSVDYPDPAAWMTRLLSTPLALDRAPAGDAGFPVDWVPADLATERDRLVGLRGRERFDAAIALASRVSSSLAVIPFVEFGYSQLVSDRVGCVSFRAGAPELDLVAACPR